MIIYGLMLMGLCMFAGLIIGDLLGLLLGISANIGGIGFAMLFLVVASQKLAEKGLLSKPAEQGVGFWNAMYIPIVVAMSANQNVIAALKGGPVALIAGLGAVFQLISGLHIKKIIVFRNLIGEVRPARNIRDLNVRHLPRSLGIHRNGANRLIRAGIRHSGGKHQ